MKKIISIILISIILLIPIVSKAAIEVTEEKLIKTVEKMQQNLDKDAEGFKIKIDKETDKIILTDANGKNYEMTYKLEEKPEFSVEIKINDKMSQEEITEEVVKIILPPLGFFMITDMNGTNLVDSLSYLLAKAMDGLKLDEIVDIDKIIEAGGDTSNSIDYEKIKELYGDSAEININDELFTFSLKEDMVTEMEGTLKITLAVNTDKDFSILDGYAEKFIGDLDISNKINTNVISNGIYQKNNITANISKIPQTGNEISLVKVLTTIIIMSGIMMISLSIYNRKRNS